MPDKITCIICFHLYKTLEIRVKEGITGCLKAGDGRKLTGKGTGNILE